MGVKQMYLVNNAYLPMLTLDLIYVFDWKDDIHCKTTKNLAHF